MGRGGFCSRSSADADGVGSQALGAYYTSALIQCEAVSALVLAWQVGKLTRDPDFGCLDGDKRAYEWILNDGKCCIASSAGKIAKLPTFRKDLLTSPEVDGKGDGNNDPDGAVERRHPEEIPFRRDPAP